MYPIRSPGPTIAKRTPDNIGQTTRSTRKSSTKKMRLIWRDRISLRPAADSSFEGQRKSASWTGAALLPLARALLLPVADHRRMHPKLRRQLRPGSSPRRRCCRYSHFAPLYLNPLSKIRSAEDHGLTAPPMHFPQICSVRNGSPAGQGASNSGCCGPTAAPARASGRLNWGGLTLTYD